LGFYRISMRRATVSRARLLGHGSNLLINKRIFNNRLDMCNDSG
jgi:hypothetical protein